MIAIVCSNVTFNLDFQSVHPFRRVRGARSVQKHAIQGKGEHLKLGSLITSAE